jgi:hypothetical protein
MASISAEEAEMGSGKTKFMDRKCVCFAPFLWVSKDVETVKEETFGGIPKITSKTTFRGAPQGPRRPT